MPASADFLQEYQQAEAAYTQGNFEEAAGLVYKLIESYPEDPSARLLCGHIYGYGLQQYDVAQEQYSAVLSLTDNTELVEQAQAALTETNHFVTDAPDSAMSLMTDSTGGLDLQEIESAVEPQTDADLGYKTFDSTIDDDLTQPDPGRGEIPLAQEIDFEEINFSEADLGEGSIDTDLKDFDPLELSQSHLKLEELEDDLNLENLDLSKPLNDDGHSHFTSETSELTQPDQSPLNFPESEAPLALDEAHIETDLNSYVNDSELVNPLSDNPFQSQSSPSSHTQEEVGELFEEDPFALDQAAVMAEDLEDDDPFSGDLLLNDPAQSSDLDPQDNGTRDSSSDTFEDLDDIFQLPRDNQEMADPSTAALDVQNGSTAYLNQPSDPENHEPTTGELALDGFNDDLEDIFTPTEEFGELSFPDPDSPSPLNGNRGKSHPESSMTPPHLSVSRNGYPENGKMGLSESPNPNFNLQTEEAETLITDASEPLDSFHTPPQNEFDSVFDSSALNSNDLVDDSSISVDLSDEFDRSVPFNETEDPEVDSPHTDADDFLDDFEEFDDLGNIPDFEVAANENSAFAESTEFDEEVDSNFVATTTSSAIDHDSSSISNSEVFGTLSLDQEAVTTFTPQTEDAVETTLSVEQGPLAFLENAPLKTKFFYTAIGAGIASLISVALTTNIATQTAVYDKRNEVISYLRTTGWVMTAVAGLSSFGAAWLVGRMTSRQMIKASDDLQAQFDAVTKNNLKARATVYATDELGQMSTRFNQMAQSIETTTLEAQRKAEEQEEAKENLQRQVIRLLDDVEGAARGDLTVTAEVTADVLGAVADSFNLTIQNLREIVVQVKHAARQVSKGATDSSIFAKDVAGDALRQAEELAATLNSVQVLTDAIQRVADCAREAEEVARSAAAVATKGGESVQMTVAGILKIRETVAETTRDVKRLAESSQEISKIVAIISNIASRTNLLALNASIEAARAGEAGRGFAIVADEVRQLADKSAKSLKEIEQIVMQIQSQTSSVMMAMEEGNQQVIEGTRLAEDAKRSLDDIIQVTNRIDVLVRSITADTVEQNETARAVAQVMQAVEHSAQETSQEAHRVSSALNNLVGVARDLLTSVERFRVDPSERQ